MNSKKLKEHTMQPWLYAIISVLFISIISMVGVLTLALKKDLLEKMLLFMVSFAVGGLFGDAFIHLLPEAFDRIETNLTTSLLILLGIIIFFILEKFLRWRHCHTGEHTHTEPFVMLNLVGDAVHNLIDGMIIGASYLVSIPIGITTTLAVILHEIPQEIGDFGILVHGGLSIKKALLFNFLSGVFAVAGALIALTAGPRIEGFAIHILPFTAGGFIYIAGSDLIPELQKGCDIKPSAQIMQLLCILSGIGIMAMLTLV